MTIYVTLGDVKVAVPMHSASWSSAERTLRREIEIMTNTRHPNLVRLFGYFYDQNRVYLIMEFVSKGEVFDLLYESGPFSERRTARYVKDLADALLYLHKKNIIHRDIKPENLLIDAKGRIKLADFGWSAHTKPGRKRRTMCGTTEYIPPELVKRQPHGEKVDVWALGILTYEFLYGKAPFTGKTRKEIFDKVDAVKFTFPKSFSEEAKTFISQILQRDPAKRLKLEEVPNHPFIEKYCGDGMEVSGSDDEP
jgi:serine/threonine protein kinase